MSITELGCRATIIGSMPHHDPAKACALIGRFLKDIPAWPQLTKKSFLENMYAQYSEGFPGVVIQDNRILVDRSRDTGKTLEELYLAYLENNADKFPIGRDYASGLYNFLDDHYPSAVAVKGQITGPLTWGLTVPDEEGRAIIHDEMLGDAVPKLLRLKAAWQEKELSRISKKTIIFVDEPYMAAYGSSASAGVFSSPGKIVEMLNEVFEGISGLKGIHCCGNTDWSVLLKTKLDILSFDTYNYVASLTLYPDAIKKFLGNGGAIAWGIVPSEEELLRQESVASLKDRLEEAMAPFTRNGLKMQTIVAQSLLTPSCGLAGMTEEAAERVLEMLAALSENMRGRYL
jgi:methionine synthase II (cobalamin-independent)